MVVLLYGSDSIAYAVYSRSRGSISENVTFISVQLSQPAPLIIPYWRKY